MSNSAWLVIASLLQQGPVEGAPYCMSGRAILSVWWFFMMILIAMYTANLAAFLTGFLFVNQLCFECITVDHGQ